MPPTPYRSVLSTAQQRMSTAIAQIRSSIPHAGEIGGLVERVFRTQIRDVLPEKVGVSNGFVVDSKGSVSRQMDIILFDRQNTPRIFGSEGAQMFPVESTYACGEVKTEMNSAQFLDSFDKCVSYKTLLRSAYISNSNSTFEQVHTLFGQPYEHWQSIFFCVAAHSINTGSLKATYKKIVEDRSLKVHERVDTFVALDATDSRNMLLNAVVDPKNGIPRDGSVDFLPSPNSTVSTYRAKEPWSLFVMLLLRYMTQVRTEQLNMVPYGGSDPY